VINYPITDRKIVAVIAAVGGLALLYALHLASWSPGALFITPDQLGSILMEQQKFPQAAAAFSDPMWRGTALYRAGRFKEAAAAFGRARSAEALYNRGNALLMDGSYDDAIASYQEALTLRPDWREAADNLALAQRRQRLLAPANDGTLGTDGRLAADEIVFTKGANGPTGEQTESVEQEGQLSDQEIRAMWLRRVQSRPADFLRAKFSYQNASRGGSK